MHGGPKNMFKPYIPSTGVHQAEYTRHFDAGRPSRVYQAQHFRDNIRKTHPPTLFLDDLILATGLEEYEDRPMQPSQMLRPTPPYEKRYLYCHTIGEVAEGDKSDDGAISPLELPPRLITFGAVDRGKSESMLLRQEPMLDLRELDRRLESVARIERLEKAGLLNAFFSLAGTARI